jgi:putative transcriptional regulator
MADDEEDHRIVCRLDELLERRGLTLAELSRRVEMSVVNLSVLKNNRGRAIRFTTLTRLCEELHCTPGDLFELRRD